MNLKISPVFAIGILILIGVLAIALIRGCQNEKKVASALTDTQGRIDKLKQDSSALANKLAANADTAKFLEGQLSLSKNKEIALSENLDKANDRISILLRKHIPIKPNPDTSVTIVPNVYIEECADCFWELSNGRDSVKKYRAEKDNQEQIYKSKLGVKDNSIKYLETANKVLTSNYKSLIDSAKKVQDILKPRGRLYLSWGVLWSPWPVGAGCGLMYQTKRNLVFGLKGYYGIPRDEKKTRTTLETTINLPLSLRKIK